MGFGRIYGHMKQIELLQNAITMNRIPHACLFSGMRGIGKRTVAEVFAKVLNCQKKNTLIPESCEECSSCQKAVRGTHPDIIRVKPEGQFIHIKEIRDIQEQMAFSPFEGVRRVVIMDEAERMTSVAANALLKTLEETSLSNILILVTPHPYQIPMTVLSRCQHVRFNPLRRETVESYLRDRVLMDQEESTLLASYSRGSIGYALELHEESFLDLRGKLLEIMRGITTKDTLHSLSMIGYLGRDRREVLRALEVLMTGYRDALVFRETGERELLINRDKVEIIQSVAASRSSKDLLRCMRIVEQAMGAIERNANKQLTLELMVFKLIAH